MSELNQPPMIKVLGFKSTYERLPVKGGPLDDNLDEKGFKLDTKGKRILENQEVDWVHYAPAHAIQTASTWDRIKQINPSEVENTPKSKEKLGFMNMRWSIIGPAYKAWKDGHEIAVNGTPLGMWAGVSGEKADVLRRYGIRTVEEVAALVETQLEKIPLPAMRSLRKEAIAFLENRGAADAAAREAERDEEIASLKSANAEMQERMSAMMELLEQQDMGGAQGGTDEVSALHAELDALGIKYHHKAGPDKLKALLAEAKAA
jgi:hypothetical protein